MLIESLIAGLNPNVEKNRFQYLLKENYKVDYNYESADYRCVKDFFLSNLTIKNIEESIKEEIDSISLLKDDWNGMGTKAINPDIINNSVRIINSIPPSILYYLDKDNIYPTKFGTIILDWEFGNKNNILSLEIARHSVGYFMEVNGEDFKQVETLSLAEDSFDNTVSDVIADLISFL